MLQLPITGPFTAKDQLKADKANKFIGRGSLRSSTHKYAVALGAAANCGVYSPSDTVFVSAEGARYGRIDPDFDEIERAVVVGVTFITDTPIHRAREFNRGERQVAAYIIQRGYREVSPGTWRKS